ncbi:Trimethylguanosine synthase [Geranomyces michiganensis]|nr:Trimethylguanosine synthase [Geranomyces michiganensis]
MSTPTPHVAQPRHPPAESPRAQKNNVPAKAAASLSTPKPSATKKATKPTAKSNPAKAKPTQPDTPISQPTTPVSAPQMSRAAAFLAKLREQEINGGEVESTSSVSTFAPMQTQKPPPSSAMLQAMKAVLGHVETTGDADDVAETPTAVESVEEGEEGYGNGEKEYEDGEEEWQDDSMYIWSEEHIPGKLRKYWLQRYNLFSRFDEGVMLDEGGWEPYRWTHFAGYAAFHFSRAPAGGNSIQFAMTCKKVIAIDIDPVKLRCARHNAHLYGVADKIEFVLGDALEVLARKDLRADAVFLSPPWGGPSYLKADVYDFYTMLPLDGATLFAHACAISRNVCLYMPRNSDRDQLIALAPAAAAAAGATTTTSTGSEQPPTCEIEEEHLNGRQKAVAAYYGGLVRIPSSSSS